MIKLGIKPTKITGACYLINIFLTTLWIFTTLKSSNIDCHETLMMPLIDTVTIKNHIIIVGMGMICLHDPLNSEIKSINAGVKIHYRQLMCTMRMSFSKSSACHSCAECVKFALQVNMSLTPWVRCSWSNSMKAPPRQTYLIHWNWSQ
jgi:hypothetical protein